MVLAIPTLELYPPLSTVRKKSSWKGFNGENGQKANSYTHFLYFYRWHWELTATV